MPPGHTLTIKIHSQCCRCDGDRIHGFCQQDVAAQFKLPAYNRLGRRHLETQFKIKRLTRLNGAGRERQFVNFIDGIGGAVIPVQLRIADLNAAYLETLQRLAAGCSAGLVTALCRFLRRGVGRFKLCRNIRPVGYPLFILAQVQSQAVEPDRVHFQLLAQQRQQLDPHLYGFHARHVGSSKAFCITELRRPDIQSQPREYRQGQITFDTQRTARLLFYGCRDLVLVVIGINHQRQYNRSNHHQNDQQCNQSEKNFQ